jgi:hypothetical protein
VAVDVVVSSDHGSIIMSHGGDMKGGDVPVDRGA